MGTKKNWTGEGEDTKPLTEMNMAKRVQKIKKALLMVVRWKIFLYMKSLPSLMTHWEEKLGTRNLWKRCMDNFGQG